MTRPVTFFLMFLSTLPVVIDALRITFHEQTGADLTHYVDHGILIALHVIGGIAFSTLGALQVAPWFRSSHLRWHRIAGRVLVIGGAMAGTTALWLNVIHPPAEGIVKEIGIYVFATIELFALTMAMVKIRQRNITCHRAWMLRAWAIGMAPTSQLLFGIASMIAFADVPNAVMVAGHYAGWLVNLSLAEWAIWTGRPRRSLRAARV